MTSVILGTAQWGAGYGITNAHGRPSDEEIREQVALARSMGCMILDTARGYDGVEERIAALGLGMTVQTKVGVRGDSAGSIRTSLERARERFGAALRGVLLHDWPSLTPGEAVEALDVMAEARDSGIVPRIGVSSYGLPDLELLADVSVRIDDVQIPCSVVDQRLGDAPVIADLRARGTAIQARSVFLQGVLLDVERTTVQGRHPAVAAFHAFCAGQGVTPLGAALAYVRTRPWIDAIVIGASTPQDLAEIADAWNHPGDDMGHEWKTLACDDPDLVDPRRWSTILNRGSS